MDRMAYALRAELATWPASHPLRDRYLRFLTARGGSAMHRDGGPEHVTTSCFVFSHDFSQVLLCFHRKGRFWVQLGGHIERGDADPAAAAFREAAEESGLRTISPLSRSALDLHRHDLHAAWGTCSAHWDIGYAGVTDPGTDLTVSPESEEVRWFPLYDLPTDVPPAGWRRRLQTVVTRAQHA